MVHSRQRSEWQLDAVKNRLAPINLLKQYGFPINTMKKYICILASAALLAACEQKTETTEPAASPAATSPPAATTEATSPASTTESSTGTSTSTTGGTSESPAAESSPTP
jgi:hypothetical protein